MAWFICNNTRNNKEEEEEAVVVIEVVVVCMKIERTGKSVKLSICLLSKYTEIL